MSKLQSTRELLDGVQELELDLGGTGETEGASNGSRRQYNRSGPTPSTQPMLGAAIMTGTEHETVCIITNIMGQSATVSIIGQPAEEVGQRGIVIGGPGHVTSFNVKLLAKIREVNPGTSDADAITCAQILGNLEPDAAVRIGTDVQIFKRLSEGLAMADPSNTQEAMTRAMEQGNIAGFVQCMLAAGEMLGAAIPSGRDERAAMGVIEGMIMLLAQQGDRRKVRLDATASEGSKGTASIVAAITDSQEASQGLTNQQKRAAMDAVSGKGGAYDPAFLRAVKLNREVRYMLAHKLAEGSRFGGGCLRTNTEALIAVAQLLSGDFESVASAAELLAAAGEGPLSAPEVIAKAVILVDQVSSNLKCLHLLGGRANAAATLWLEVSSACPKGEAETTAIIFTHALAEVIYNSKASTTGLPYLSGSMLKTGGDAESVIKTYSLNGLVPRFVAEAKSRLAKRKDNITSPATATSGAGSSGSGAIQSQQAIPALSPASKKPANPCIDFLRGKCLHGASCKYVHDPSATCPRGPTCPFLAKGSCFFPVH